MALITHVRTEEPTRIRIEETEVKDAGRAAIVRDQQLTPRSAGKPLVLIDVNAMHLLSIGAAEELFVRWMRDRRRKSPGDPVVVFATYDGEVARIINTALREGRESAYLVRSSPTHDIAQHQFPRIIGDVTPAQSDTIAAVVAQGGAASAREVADRLKLTPPAATNRLVELVDHGLLFREARPGKQGDLFKYPFEGALARTSKNGKPARSR
jgi:hypothetical protein